jgi:hypothetical protein
VSSKLDHDMVKFLRRLSGTSMSVAQERLLARWRADMPVRKLVHVDVLA